MEERETVAVPGARAAVDAEFSVFYRTDMPRLVGFLRWQGVPLSDATDVAQEAMLEAYRRWADIEYPKAWVRRVASRCWVRRVASAPEEPVADPPGGVLTVTDIEAWEGRHHVLGLLDLLPARQRQVLAWWLDGFRATEIAVELRMSPDAVRASLFRARRALENHLGESDDE
ncbi:RNA polymerase sigma factor [Phytomonospora sp. NPDC050363]|uniref:RNA polymerase sigma factor n=1 Tax=Phytomonospora sp. NPDC050363 TaxID=3155642 RepID=UPI0033CF6BEA